MFKTTLLVKCLELNKDVKSSENIKPKNIKAKKKIK